MSAPPGVSASPPAASIGAGGTYVVGDERYARRETVARGHLSGREELRVISPAGGHKEAAVHQGGSVRRSVVEGGVALFLLTLLVVVGAPAEAQTVLLDIKGEGGHTSPKFTAPSDWRLEWSFECPRETAPFFVHVRKGDGSASGNRSVSQSGRSGSGIENYHSGGELFLEVATSTDCSWAVKAIAAQTAPTTTQVTTVSSTTTTRPATPTATTSPAQVTPDSVAPGGFITVSGSGFAPNSSLSVTFAEAPAVVPNATATASGTYSFSLTVPSGTAPGSRRIVVTGRNPQGGQHQSSGTVTVQAAPITTTTPPGLPQTGPRSPYTGPIAVAGALLFLLGWWIYERASWSAPVSRADWRR